MGPHQKTLPYGDVQICFANSWLRRYKATYFTTYEAFNMFLSFYKTIFFNFYLIILIYLFFVHRLGNTGMSSGMGGGTLGSAHCQLANQPLVMPVFPLRASQPSPVPVYSPSRFHIDKRCQHRCTWKCLAIAMICLCVILAAMLAYFIGKYFSYM